MLTAPDPPRDAPPAAPPQAEVDAVVVGSGAGGAPVAWALAQAGATVAVLERGPRYGERDFVHDEVRQARRHFFVPSAATDPHIVAVAGGDEVGVPSDAGWVASCVGGGTVHMSGFFYRLHPVDLRLATTLGGVAGAELADWPIAYEALAPYYGRIAALIGVSGVDGAGEGSAAPPRQWRYPLAPVQSHPVAGVIEAAAARLGAHAFPTARAITSAPYAGRAACVYCHLCGGYGCESGAKSSTLVSLLPAAEATGNCRVIAGARVTQILARPDGGADGVSYRDAAGLEQRIRARVVVVACSAVESARLLLLSPSIHHPQGFGNNQGQVGRHLMFSTLSKAHGEFRYRDDPPRAEMLRDHAPFVGRSVLDYYLTPADAPVRKGGALNFLFPAGGPISQAEAVATEQRPILWGRTLKARLMHYWHEQRQIDCETFGEYLPTPGSRVELHATARDSADLPAARIVIDRHPHDAEVSRYLAGKAAEILTAAGAERVWQSDIGGRTMHLPLGTCRMGDDPATSVVDADCRLHDVDNLYASDGSVFPSSGGVPPTFTILANALRVGDGIARRMAAGEL